MQDQIPHTPPAWPGYEVHTDRLRLYTRRGGDPSALKMICLHGWAVHGGMYENMREVLEDRFELIVPDLRGHGLSEAPRRGYSIDSMADDIVGLMDAEGIEQADLMGYSLGGFVALAIAQRHPHRARRLCLLATAPRHDGLPQRLGLKLIAGLWQVLPPRTLAQVTSRLLSGPGLPDGMDRILPWLMQHNTREGITGGAWGLSRVDLRDGIRRVHQPTLVVTGGKDVAIRRKDWQPLTDALPNSEHHHIPDAGHGMAASHGEAIGQIVLDFLDAHPPDARPPRPS